MSTEEALLERKGCASTRLQRYHTEGTASIAHHDLTKDHTLPNSPKVEGVSTSHETFFIHTDSALHASHFFLLQASSYCFDHVGAATIGNRLGKCCCSVVSIHMELIYEFSA